MRPFKTLSFFSFVIAPCIALSWVFFAYAVDITSTNFIIRDPMVGTGGGYGSSSSFGLFSAGNITFSARGSSTNFGANYGFLYFPFVSDVTLTATPNGDDADLSWPAATSSEGLGWTVAGYNTGIASVSGGPYTYTDVTNVTTYTYADLAPGEYCFVLQTYDALGYIIATSNEDCITIEPTITFDLDTASGGGNGESSAPYTVDLGTISVADTRVSGTIDGTQMVVVEADTNAPGGIVVLVSNANGANGLVSTATPAHDIGSSDGTMAGGTENYGLCVATAGLVGFSRAAPYNSGTCVTDLETNAIQALTTTGESILTTAGSPVVGGHAEVLVNGAASATTNAHADYSDALLFIATPTF